MKKAKLMLHDGQMKFRGDSIKTRLRIFNFPYYIHIALYLLLLWNIQYLKLVEVDGIKFVIFVITIQKNPNLWSLIPLFIGLYWDNISGRLAESGQFKLKQYQQKTFLGYLHGVRCTIIILCLTLSALWQCGMKIV